MTDPQPVYDDGESFDATDTGGDVVPPGTTAALLAVELDKWAAACDEAT